MATSTINATYQGRVGISVTAAIFNWLIQVRNATTGTFANTYTSNATVTNAVEATYDESRVGYTGTCARVPLFFDVSSITATNTITAATLKVWNGYFFGGTIMDTIIVEGSAWGGNGSTTTLSTANYNDLDFSTAYSSKLTSWAGSSYNDFTMNATAISDMNANGYLNCFLIGEYDYDDTAPPLGEYPAPAAVEYLDATNKIKVELTYSPSGYGNDVMGVAAVRIDNVIGVAKANIGNIIGV
jgi:hypothetical protein